MKIKKIFLYLTGFFSGMSVMAIELGASRLMAPYYSSSQIVYTIIIGTVMIAMAIGNIIGGKMADKYSDPTKLFKLIFIASCWIALIPFVGKYIIAGVAVLLAASNLSSNFLVFAAFISCILVFVFPLLIFGMVTPNLIKYAVGNLEENGKVVGTIEALGTIGSIIGTFLPTFVTIPYIGTSWTFIIFSIVLFIICVTYFIMRKFHIIIYSVIAVVILTISIVFGANGSIAFFSKDTAYEGESIYNYLRVEKDDNQTILSTNVLFGVQSIKKNRDGLTGLYYDYALASNYMVDNERSNTLDGINNEKLDILILGLGTGTFAYQSNLYYKNCDIDGVEIDSKIVGLATKYFDLPSNVNVYVNDGRAFLDVTDKKYDVILVDAYQDITIPFQMSSIEFFKKVKDHLKDKGVMVVNLNMYTNNEGGINDYICGTIRNCFDNAYKVKCNTNCEVYACNGFDLKESLTKSINLIENTELKTMMTRVYSKMEFVEKNGYILTDDKAPVELLGMDVLDDMIFDELDYYRNLIKGKSIREVIQMAQNGELF